VAWSLSSPLQHCIFQWGKFLASFNIYWSKGIRNGGKLQICRCRCQSLVKPLTILTLPPCTLLVGFEIHCPLAIISGGTVSGLWQLYLFFYYYYFQLYTWLFCEIYIITVHTSWFGRGLKKRCALFSSPELYKSFVSYVLLRLNFGWNLAV
jgi:hypothetical protein